MCIDSDKVIVVEDIFKEFKVPKDDNKLSWIKKKLKYFYREWESKTVVDNINFSIKKGDIVGYLGANGAGKSTSIKMLTGILTPTSGKIKVLNRFEPVKDREEYVKHIGVVFGQRSSLVYDIPVIDSYNLFRVMYEIDKKTFEERFNYFIKILKVEHLINVPYRKLSLGERMRFEIIAAFLHKPEIVFLDEPTIGLDASAKKIVRKFLKTINKEDNVTIIITTHDMDDIEDLCKNIIFIDKGCVLYDGSLLNFKKKYSDWRTLNINYKKIYNKENLDNLLLGFNSVTRDNQNNTIRLQVASNQDINLFLKQLLDVLEIADIEIAPPRLEDVVEGIYEKSN